MTCKPFFYAKVYSYIPMGMYISGIFDENNELTNIIKKYVSTSYGTGTSYGLRICTRFTTTPDSNINMSDVHVSSENTENYSAFCKNLKKIENNI